MTSPNVGGHFFHHPKKCHKKLPRPYLKAGVTRNPFGVKNKKLPRFFLSEWDFRCRSQTSQFKWSKSFGHRKKKQSRRVAPGGEPVGLGWGWVAGKTPHVRYQSSYPHVRYQHENQSLDKGLLTRVVPFIKKAFFTGGGGWKGWRVYIQDGTQGWWE